MHFNFNEVVDAIDECYIWWQAKIIEFIGDWEIVVRWKEIGKEKSKIQIKTTVRKTSEKWNVRRTEVTSQEVPQKEGEPTKFCLTISPNSNSLVIESNSFKKVTLNKDLFSLMTRYRVK